MDKLRFHNGIVDVLSDGVATSALSNIMQISSIFVTHFCFLDLYLLTDSSGKPLNSCLRIYLISYLVHSREILFKNDLIINF